MRRILTGLIAFTVALGATGNTADASTLFSDPFRPSEPCICLPLADVE
jgi:hypothetical protein